MEFDALRESKIRLWNHSLRTDVNLSRVETISIKDTKNKKPKISKKEKTLHICIGYMYDYKSYDQCTLPGYVFFVFMQFGIMRFEPLPFRLYRMKHLSFE